MTILKNPEGLSMQENVFKEEIYCSLLPAKENTAVSLCLNCGNNDYCFWQENKKTYCEHYQ